MLEQTQLMLWNDPGLIQDRLTTITINAMAPMALELTQAQNEAKELYLAFTFLSGADRQRYGPLLLEWKTLTFNELISIPPLWSRHIII